MKPYEVEIFGNKTTQLLSDADAKARGLLTPVEPKVETKAKTPVNKGRKPATKRAKTSAVAPTGSDDE